MVSKIRSIMPYFNLILICNMANQIDFIGKLNDGELTPEVLGEFSTDLIKNVRESITQKFHREKMNDEERRFSEFIII